MNKIDFYIRLHNIIQKIIHRCNPSEYASFDDLMSDINGTVFDDDYGSTFIDEDDINWIKSDPELNENIIELCKINFEESKGGGIEGTIHMILVDLDLIYQPKSKILNISFDFKNLSYLQKHTEELCEILESQLILNDLSILPYKNKKPTL